MWVKVSALKGWWSASAWMMCVFLVVLAFALVFACFRRFRLVSMPIICLACLAMWLKSSPVPHPVSRTMASFIKGIFWSVAVILASCSSLYCLSYAGAVWS